MPYLNFTTDSEMQAQSRLNADLQAKLIHRLNEFDPLTSHYGTDLGFSQHHLLAVLAFA